jgi:hypothetical protein
MPNNFFLSRFQGNRPSPLEWKKPYTISRNAS